MEEAARHRAQQQGLRSLARSQRVAVLRRAAGLINRINEQRAQCIEAVALLERVASLVRIRVEPVATAIAVQGSFGAVQLGTAVDGIIPLTADATVLRDPRMNDWAGAGHLFLYARQERIMFDPTLDQVGPNIGFPIGPLIQEIEPSWLDGDIPFEIDDEHKVLYRIVRTDTTWRPGYNMVFAMNGGRARQVLARALELEGLDAKIV